MSSRPNQGNEPEQVLGVWRRSMMHPGFWWRAILTLGLYVLLLWRRNQITVTDRRVTQRKGGILGGQEVSVSIEKITDVSIRTSPIGAILGYSYVSVQSAGSPQSEIAFDGIADSKHLREVIFSLQDQLREKEKDAISND